MGDGLYLGRQVDLESGKPGAKLDLDPADLLTHGLIVGMTGSGKTGLAIVLVEELLRQGVPVIAIDPKGDLANLLLLFERLDAASFEPWIDPEAARRDGKDVGAAAADAAASWKKGLAEWGLGPADIAALREGPRRGRLHAGLARRACRSTCCSRSARRACPSIPPRRTCATRSRRSSPGCSASCGWRRTRSSPPAVFLATLVERSWRAGKGLDLESLIGADRGAALRQDRRPAARDGLPAQGAPGPHDGAQQPARLAVVRELAGGGAARRGPPAARPGREAAPVDRLDRAPRPTRSGSSSPRSSSTRSRPGCAGRAGRRACARSSTWTRSSATSRPTRRTRRRSARC